MGAGGELVFPLVEVGAWGCPRSLVGAGGAADEVTDAEWKAWQRRPPVTVQDAEAIREALPPNTRWAIQDIRWFNPQTKYVRGGPQVIAQATPPR